MATRTRKIYLDTVNRKQYSGFNSLLTTPVADFFLADQEILQIIPMQPNPDSTSSQKFIPVDSDGSYYAAVGVLGLFATAGTFNLTDPVTSTTVSSLSASISASALQASLRTITTYNACVVTQNKVGDYTIDRVTVGTVASPLTGDGADLFPESFANITVERAGTSTASQVLTLTLDQAPAAYADSGWTSLPDAAVTVVNLVTGSATQNAVFRISINPDAYQGSFILTSTVLGAGNSTTASSSPIAFNSTDVDMQAQIIAGWGVGNEVVVDQVNAYTWDVQFTGANILLKNLTQPIGNAAGLSVPVGIEGILSFLTNAAASQLAGEPQVGVTFQIKNIDGLGVPQTWFFNSAVLNTSLITPQTLGGSSVSNPITQAIADTMYLRLDDSNNSPGFITSSEGSALFDALGAAAAILTSNNTFSGTQLFNGAVTFGSSTTITGSIQQRFGSGVFGSVLLSGEGYQDTTNNNYYQGNGSANTLIGGPGFYRGVVSGTAGTGSGTHGAAGSISTANQIVLTAGNGGNATNTGSTGGVGGAIASQISIIAGNGGGAVTSGAIGGAGGDITAPFLQITSGAGGGVLSGGLGTGGTGSAITEPVFQINGGSGGNASATSASGTIGGAATGITNAPLFIVNLGSGGGTGTSNSGSGANAGNFGGTIFSVTIGNAGNSVAAAEGGGGGNINFTPIIQLATGNGGNAGTTGGFGGGGGGDPFSPALSAQGGNGGNGATTGNGGQGGNYGFIVLDGAAGANAVTTVSGGNGGSGGSINLAGTGAVGAANGANGGTITLSGSVNTILTSGATQFTITLPSKANVTMADIPLMTANTTATVTFNALNRNETQYNISTAQATVTINLPTTSQPGQEVQYATGVVSTVTMGTGTIDLGTTLAATVAKGVYIWRCSTSGHWIRIQ